MKPSREVEWVNSEDVKVGDSIVFLLSDAEAYAEVIGWSDSTRAPHDGLGTSVRRDWNCAGVPWWAREMLFTYLTFDGSVTASKTLIVKRPDNSSPE